MGRCTWVYGNFWPSTLHWMLLVTYTKFIAVVLMLVVLLVLSPSNYLLAIPKVGSRTPTIALDALGHLY